MSENDVVDRGRLEGRVTGYGVVQCPCQAVHVGEKCFRLSSQLLRRNIVRRAPDLLGVIHPGLRFADKPEVYQLRLMI